MKLGILDNLAQLALHEDNLDECRAHLEQCAAVIAKCRVPARSWYDLAHQITRCVYFERLQEWDRILAIVEDVDQELARRQFKALRTLLLCAKARALARRGKPRQADAALAAAVRICPRGAIDPLIVLEASKAICAAVAGESTRATVHFDRALAACRAIGHRYHERWIDRAKHDLSRPVAGGAQAGRDAGAMSSVVLLNDVATMLGSGHSIDLLAHRAAAILQNTSLAAHLHTHAESGHPHQADPSASFETEGDQFRIILRGADRQVTLSIRAVQTIEEISLLKSLADVVQAAVNRTIDSEADDEDQNLWPSAVAVEGGDTIFRSPRMVELLKVAYRLAATDLPLLICGETGTGKEVLARLIHERSRARSGPFVAFNCSALPRELVESQLFGHRRGAFTGAMDSFPGVIRAAERGTLFLDEVADIDFAVQPKLLRFLESSEVHPVGEVRAQRVGVRVIAATNATLEDRVDQGAFRRDLFYRLGVGRLTLPPLRERKDEIPALAALFLGKFARECDRQAVRLSDDVIAALLLHDWPGNIRQLANEIRRMVAMATDGQTLTSADLSPDISRAWNTRTIVLNEYDGPAVPIRLDQPLERAIEDLERKFIAHAMSSAGGHVAEAAQILGISRKGLFLKRRRRGLLQ